MGVEEEGDEVGGVELVAEDDVSVSGDGESVYGSSTCCWYSVRFASFSASVWRRLMNESGRGSVRGRSSQSAVAITSVSACRSTFALMQVRWRRRGSSSEEAEASGGRSRVPRVVRSEASVVRASDGERGEDVGPSVFERRWSSAYAARSVRRRGLFGMAAN